LLPWTFQILPYSEEKAVYDKRFTGTGYRDFGSTSMHRFPIQMYSCPSRGLRISQTAPNGTNYGVNGSASPLLDYAAVHGANGSGGTYEALNNANPATETNSWLETNFNSIIQPGGFVDWGGAPDPPPDAVFARHDREGHGWPVKHPHVRREGHHGASLGRTVERRTKAISILKAVMGYGLT
jgi:post-segregation antitoxin (ccd killing protein)